MTISDDQTELIEAIRAEVVKRHNVLLNRDDPIFVTVTCNEMVLAHYADMVAARVDAATDRSIAASAAQVQAAKETAAKLINDASGYVADQVRRAAKGGAEEFTDVIKRKLDGADRDGREAYQARSGAMWAAIAAGACAVISIACALVVVIKV